MEGLQILGIIYLIKKSDMLKFLPKLVRDATSFLPEAANWFKSFITHEASQEFQLEGDHCCFLLVEYQIQWLVQKAVPRLRPVIGKVNWPFFEPTTLYSRNKNK